MTSSRVSNSMGVVGVFFLLLHAGCPPPPPPPPVSINKLAPHCAPTCSPADCVRGYGCKAGFCKDWDWIENTKEENSSKGLRFVVMSGGFSTEDEATQNQLTGLRANSDAVAIAMRIGVSRFEGLFGAKGVAGGSARGYETYSNAGVKVLASIRGKIKRPPLAKSCTIERYFSDNKLLRIHRYGLVDLSDPATLDKAINSAAKTIMEDKESSEDAKRIAKDLFDKQKPW